MIPLHLTLKGVYSYQKEQKIDFSKLTAAKLFGIFGSVGSGKSTILESISFALYGQTERLNRTDRIGYNMMNLKSDELYIDFIFKAGENEEIYKFEVLGKRHPKKFDEVKTLERRAYKKQNDTWLPLEHTNAEAEEILGLNYDNFKRTIIIPQGKFADFLQLTGAPRTEMIQEIFQLNRFDLSEKAISLANQLKAELNQIQGQLEHLTAVVPAVIEEKKKDLLALNATIGELEAHLQHKQVQEQTLSSICDLYEKVAQQKQMVEALEKNEATYNQLKEKIKDYEYCSLNFKSLLENIKANQYKLNQLQQENKGYTQQYQDIIHKIEEKYTDFSTVKSQYLQKENWLKEVEELKKIEDLHTTEQQIQQLTQALQEKEQQLQKEIIQDYTQIITNLKTLTEKIEATKAKIPNWNIIDEMKTWLVTQKNMLAQQKEAQAALLLTSQKIQAVQVQIAQLKDEKLASLGNKEADLTYLKGNLETTLEEIAHQIQHLTLQENLKIHAAKLRTEGGSCPICGATQHPHLLVAEEVEEALQQATQTKNTLKEKLRYIDTYFIPNFLKLETNLAHLQVQAQAHEAKINQFQVSQSSTQDFEKWSTYKIANATDLEVFLSNINALQQEMQDLESQKQHIEKEKLQLEQQKEHFQLELGQLQKEYAIAVDRKQNRLQELTFYTPETWQTLPLQNIKKQITALQKNYDLINTQYQTLEQEIQLLNHEKIATQTTLQIKVKQQGDYEISLTNWQTELNASIAKSSYQNITWIETILEKEWNIETERKKVETFYQHLHTAQKQYQNVLEESKGKVFDPQVYAHLIVEIAEINDKINQSKDERGKAKKELENLEQNLEKKLILEEKYSQLQIRDEDLTTLKKLFHGNGFVNYVASVHLQALCRVANERFYKLTHQHLRLELSEDNQFLVRDYLNDGKLRSVKTLSGGQTFQASLCLALALADSVAQQLKASQNFFFIDEGFGSQDKQTLQTVFDTLKSLQRENRIVGFISHVEELQQEINVHLKIDRDEEGSSRVRESWKY